MSDKLKIVVNGSKLTAQKVDGKWSFTCKEWPDLTARFNGAESANEAIEEFTRRALAGAVMVKKLAQGKK